MPSTLHEVLVALFRNRPALVADLLRPSHGPRLPPFEEVRVGSAEFTAIKPAQYHADLVVLLAGQAIEHGLIVEVQLSIDNRKRYTWPVYVYNLRAQLSCPVSLVVVTLDEKVAHWAETRVETGIDNTFAPLVVHPSAVSPDMSKMQAGDVPELAALSGIMHVGDGDTRTAEAAFDIGLSAVPRLPAELGRVCFDLLQIRANDSVRRRLRSMDFSTYEFQGELSKRLIAMGREEGRSEGRQEGRAEGQAALLVRLLTLRFGPLSQDVQACIRKASSEELDLISERVLTAPTLQQALGAHETAT